MDNQINNDFSYHLNKYMTEKGGSVEANNQADIDNIWEACLGEGKSIDANDVGALNNFVFNLTQEYNVALNPSEVTDLIGILQDTADLYGKDGDHLLTLDDFRTEKVTENGEQYDVKREYSKDGTYKEVFYQNGTMVKARDYDAQGRITKGTHFDENGKEKGHYNRVYNTDGSSYDTWYDGDNEKNYRKSTVTYRDPIGNTTTEIRFDCNTGKPINPAPRTITENGITYEVRTECKPDGSYVETLYHDGIKSRVRNCNAQGRIIGGTHYNTDGSTKGQYNRTFNPQDGSYVDIWHDNGAVNARVETYRDAFGNTVNEIKYDENNQIIQ